MAPNSVFNATVCVLGVFILLIHIANLLFKKERRKDENYLLIFFAFTAIHFMTYFVYVMVKEIFTSNAYIMGFYTTFYIFNNIEVLLFYLYMSSYTQIPAKTRKVVNIINFSLLAIFVISDIVNIFTRMYFTAIDGEYKRAQFMFISQGYQFVMLAISFFLAVTNKNLNVREKTSFSIYCALPAVSIVVQNLLPGYAIAYATMLVSIEILFVFLIVEKNIKIQEEERKLKDAEVKIMVSQIQPHFVYNTLSSISTLITLDPNKAQAALDDFTDYLRMNFSTLTETKLVSFEDELRHIKTYVNLEKMRFNDRIKIVLYIKATNFKIPPLTIQPLVENAIKHGILKKIDGGTVTIKSYEDDSAYIVEVIDDGVGFDMDSIDFDSNRHVGLNNVRHRIITMCHGDIVFESHINKGTKVMVMFYK